MMLHHCRAPDLLEDIIGTIAILGLGIIGLLCVVAFGPTP